MVPPACTDSITVKDVSLPAQTFALEAWVIISGGTQSSNSWVKKGDFPFVIPAKTSTDLYVYVVVSILNITPSLLAPPANVIPYIYPLEAIMRLPLGQYPEPNAFVKS